MTVIAKSAKRHPAAKKIFGWEEPAICVREVSMVFEGCFKEVLRVFQ